MGQLGPAGRFAFAVIAVASLAVGARAADPAGRAAAIRAADAAAGMPEAASDPSIAVCATPPTSGEKLAGDMEIGKGEGHAMTFANGGGGDAIVKLRHADTAKLAASFLVRRNEEITIEGVPDGEYLTQYAFGRALAPDCRSFTRIIKANQLPATDSFKTVVIDDEEHTEVKHMTVSYQLSVTESANMKAVSIDAAAFNAD